MMQKENLRSYILENFLFSDDPSDLNDDDSFLEKEIIDSTGILEVIEFLEQETGIKVEDDELIPDNLDSVNRIVAYVESKLNA
jgi:acyl carrier protein